MSEAKSELKNDLYLRALAAPADGAHTYLDDAPGRTLFARVS